MKDPLDPRDDPYQRVNDEAKQQGQPIQVSLATKPKELRQICGQLLPRSQQPNHLMAARDKLTRVEPRMHEDIYFYWVEDSTPIDSPLPEPPWDREQVPLPELPLNGSLIRTVTGGDEELFEPIQPRSVSLTSPTKYDEGYAQSLEIIFDR